MMFKFPDMSSVKYSSADKVSGVGIIKVMTSLRKLRNTLVNIVSFEVRLNLLLLFTLCSTEQTHYFLFWQRSKNGDRKQFRTSTLSSPHFTDTC